MSTVSFKPAATGRYRHVYNPMSILSLDFGDVVASRCTEVEKSDHWNFEEVKGTLRLAPQIFPAYGRNTLKSAAFFVPAKQLMESYDGLRSSKTIWKGKAVHQPYIKQVEINHCFALTASLLNPWVVDEGSGVSASTIYAALKSANTHWDFVWYNSVNYEYHFYSLTALGKRYYKILKSLGYDFSDYNYIQGSSANNQSIIDSANTELNALPLLAFAKVYVDYFINPHFYNTNTLVNLLHCIHDDETVASLYDQGEVKYGALTVILENLLVPYEHNMYLDSWNSPNSPDGVNPANSLENFNSDSWESPFIPSYNSPNTPVNIAKETVEINSDTNILFDTNFTPGYSAMQALTQFGLNFLDSVYKFVRRNNLFGSRAIQQFFARFGIKDSDWNAQFASKLYEGVSEIDYSAVVSQSDTVNGANGKSLASYAGFGVSGLNFKFQYKSSDPGFIIVLHWLQITPIQMTGLDPMVLRRKGTDFYTPEFDGKAIRAIPVMEVSRNKGNTFSTNYPKSIFGFTDIYEEYRNMRDVVAGDFITDENIRNFLFGRDLSWWRELNGTALQPQTNRIQYYAKGGSFGDVTNPFQWAPVNGDRFYLEVKYKISAQRNISSKSAALDLNGPGDMDMQLGGSQMR